MNYAVKLIETLEKTAAEIDMYNNWMKSKDITTQQLQIYKLKRTVSTRLLKETLQRIAATPLLNKSDKDRL